MLPPLARKQVAASWVQETQVTHFWWFAAAESLRYR